MLSDFYEKLPVFKDFAGFSEFQSYISVPDDWVVMISDVVGSTSAIKDGRYKDVNMVGAASITAVLNACGKTQVPFIFGGDGGSIIVPPDLKEKACDALRALKANSEIIFGLNLRIGAVPVKALREMGSDLRVRKYELSAGNFLAMFAGNGMEKADELLKNTDSPNPYLLDVLPETGEPDLDGLSCRWQPLMASRGTMLTMMIKAAGNDVKQERQQLSQIMTSLSRLLGAAPANAAPASKRSMRFRWPPKGLLLEARATAGPNGFWRTLLRAAYTSLVQWWCEKTGKKAGDYDGEKYAQELRSNTDFRKFDGTLRMVLDVTQDQADRIENYLAKEFAAGHLVYGTHLAESALMTCLVFSLEQSEHVHFIDGSDGGFAMAAIGFKNRMLKQIDKKTNA